MVLLNLTKRVNLILIFLLTASLINANYPVVEGVYNDNLFKQIQADLQENSKRLVVNRQLLPLQFYKYNIKEGDSIFTVSSRFNLSYDTIASLNNIENQLFFNSFKSILIPNCPGLYLSEKRDDDFTEINIDNRIVYFYPGKAFSSNVRLSFLITPFMSPLKHMNVTSEFGYRSNPFTGINEFHPGIDLKAKYNTPIYSPYKGNVIAVEYSDFYGKTLKIEHTGGYVSVYYHLNRIDVKIGDKVKKGDLIGLTGNTGRSTGPHLHLEIHYNDEPVNPRILLGDV